MSNEYLMNFNALTEDEMLDLDAGGIFAKIAGVFTAVAGVAATVDSIAAVKTAIVAGTAVGGPVGGIIAGTATAIGGTLAAIFL